MRQHMIGVPSLIVVARSMPAVAQVAQNGTPLSPPDTLNADVIPDANPRAESGDPDPSALRSSSESARP